MDKKLLKEMFNSLLHIGNKTNYWNPKMKNYIYGSINGVHVINLLESAKKLEEVKTELKILVSEWKKILFVATKLQSRDIFTNLATEIWQYYVTEKWVPGLLTNFKTIKIRISNYIKLLRDLEAWAFDVLTKKEKAAKVLELEKLDKAFRWLKEMKRIPDIIFVVDGIYEKQAVKEAKSLKLKAFGILNTNWDETHLDKIIPANTNSVKSLGFIAAALKESLINIKIIKPTTWIKKNNVKKLISEKNIKTKKEEKKIEIKPITEKKLNNEKIEEKDNIHQS